MLVLAMEKHDYVLIGRGIRVHIEDYVTDKSISMSFEAPSDVKILRGGIYKANAKEKSARPCESRAALSNLRITSQKGDYVMIGDSVKVEYKGNKKGRPSIGITAPRDMQILRRNLYEAEIKEHADQGDVHAQALLDTLQEERAQRKKQVDNQIAKAKQIINTRN